jgi:two-component system OmpR family response regulator
MSAAATPADPRMGVTGRGEGAAGKAPAAVTAWTDADYEHCQGRATGSEFGTGTHSILVVDDEPSIVDCVATALRYEGFDAHEATSGRAALASIAAVEPVLIILDWMMPDLEGIELTRRLRAHGSEVPILFLSAKDTIEAKVLALRAGGDDYITKPFDLSELVARVDALMRRIDGTARDVLRFADLTLTDGWQRVTRGDAELTLSSTEFALLRFFLANTDQVVTTSRILESVWLNEFDGSSDIVAVYMKSLLRKLDAVGPPLIVIEGRASYRMIATPALGAPAGRNLGLGLGPTSREYAPAVRRPAAQA